MAEGETRRRQHQPAIQPLHGDFPLQEKIFFEVVVILDDQSRSPAAESREGDNDRAYRAFKRALCDHDFAAVSVEEIEKQRRRQNENNQIAQN